MSSGYIVKAVGSSGTVWILANDGSWFASQSVDCKRIVKRSYKSYLPRLFDTAEEANRFIAVASYKGTQIEKVIRYDMALASIGKGGA